MVDIPKGKNDIQFNNPIQLALPSPAPDKFYFKLTSKTPKIGNTGFIFSFVRRFYLLLLF